MSDVAVDRLHRRVSWRARRLTARQVELAVLLALLALLIGVGLFPSLAATHDPLAVVDARFIPPGPAYVFGTDDIGRDLFSRVVYGLGISLSSAALAVVIGLVAGAVIGIVTGLNRGGIVDNLLSRVTEVFLAVPTILFTLAVITAMGRGTVIAAIAIGIAEVPGFARLIRGEVIRVSSFTFVEAARTYGTRYRRIVGLHIIPSIFPPVLSYTALHFGLAMLAIGSISYLGFGASPPSPEWGLMIAQGQRSMVYAWWVAIIPGVAFSLVVILVSRLSHRIQDRHP